MASRWYVNQDGEQVGPLKTVELRQIAAEGGVEPQTLVRRGEEGDWVPAGKVAGLIPNAPAKSTKAPLPVAAPLPPTPPPVAQAVPTARPIPSPAAPAIAAPAIKSNPPRTSRRGSVRPAGVPFSLAATMAVIFLLTASLGVAGVFIYIWRAGEGPPLSDAAEPNNQRGEVVRPAPPVAAPAAESPANRDDDLLLAIGQWHDAQRIRVGPQTARYQVASARLVSPAELQRLGQPHVVRKEAAPAPTPRATLPTALSGGDVNVDPSFDDPTAPPDDAVATESPADPTPTADLATSSDDGPAGEPTLLLVELRVTNLSPQAALHYDGLNGFAKDEAAALLVDDLGKRFLPLPPSEATALRRVTDFEIAPGHTLTDVLVFPAPEAGFEYLRLALPNASIGRSGGTGFEIRREMVDQSGDIDARLAQVDPPAAPTPPPTSPPPTSPPSYSKPPASDGAGADASSTKPTPAKPTSAIRDLRDSITRSLRDPKE
ncbi:MAG: DUF4339 domain-containing protein [Pirellulaceae bacterium]